MIIRRIETSDMDGYYKMLKELDSETKYMMYEVGERQATEQRFIELLARIGSGGSCMLAAIEDNSMAGIIAAERGEARRIKHTAYIWTGVLKKYRGRGIGKELFRKIEEWAKENGVTRLELTVMCHNENAIALYKKTGFEIEGTRKNAMMVDKEYVDEFYMAKLL